MKVACAGVGEGEATEIRVGGEGWGSEALAELAVLALLATALGLEG